MSSAAPIAIYGEFGNPTELVPTSELNEVLDLAALINRECSAQFNYSFQALLVAFVYARHGISIWLREYIVKSNLDLTDILSLGTLDSEDEVAVSRPPGPLTEVARLAEEVAHSSDGNLRASLYPQGRRTATGSVLEWVTEAKRLGLEQQHARVGGVTCWAR